MDTKKLAIKYFTRLKGKKKYINNVEFRTSINELKNEANTGFEEEEVETLIDALVYMEGLPSIRFQELLKCIIPSQKVAGETVLKLLEWIFSYNSTVPSGNVVAALDWITGLVEFGLTDEDSVHAFYLHLYLLIEEREKAKCACKLIYLLTKPSDVLRWLVRKVLNIENRCGRQNYTTALLGLFKSYKPDCVPEKIPAINLQFAFKNIGRMDPYFSKAQQRLRAEDGESLKRKIVWNSDGSMKKVKAQRTAPMIPLVDYVHFESEKYRAEKLRSVLEFKTTISLGSNLLKLDMPCNIMSLLQNDAGIYVLIFGDKNLQTRFSYNLYYTLQKVFIEQEAGYSYVEKENFLKRIFALEEYMQQGIPVVSRFLAGYLCIWDTDDFRETVLNLLEWVTFSSYSELHDCVLRHIHTMFLSGSIEVKSSVIAMLNKLVQNMVIFGLQRKNKKFTNVFLKNEGDWQDIETLKYVIKFVSKLCELGLSVEQDNYLLLNEALHFFEMMIFLEKFYELSMWTMAPPLVIYSGLITKNAFMLSRVCGILLKYENVSLRVKKRKLRNNFTAQVNYQKMYLTDFANCLWKKKCFDSNGSYLFKDVHEHEHLERLSKYIILNEALSLKKHFALFPYISLTQKGSNILQNLEYDSEDMLTITSSFLEEIHNLIELFIRRDS